MCGDGYHSECGTEKRVQPVGRFLFRGGASRNVRKRNAKTQKSKLRFDKRLHLTKQQGYHSTGTLPTERLRVWLLPHPVSVAQWNDRKSGKQWRGRGEKGGAHAKPKKSGDAARVNDIRRKRSSHLRHVSRKRTAMQSWYPPSPTTAIHHPKPHGNLASFVRNRWLQQCRAAQIHLQAQAGKKVGTKCMDGFASRVQC